MTHIASHIRKTEYDFTAVVVKNDEHVRSCTMQLHTLIFWVSCTWPSTCMRLVISAVMLLDLTGSSTISIYELTEIWYSVADEEQQGMKKMYAVALCNYIQRICQHIARDRCVNSSLLYRYFASSYSYRPWGHIWETVRWPKILKYSRSGGVRKYGRIACSCTPQLHTVNMSAFGTW